MPATEVFEVYLTASVRGASVLVSRFSVVKESPQFFWVGPTRKKFSKKLLIDPSLPTSIIDPHSMRPSKFGRTGMFNLSALCLREEEIGPVISRLRAEVTQEYEENKAIAEKVLGHLACFDCSFKITDYTEGQNREAGRSIRV